MATYIFARQSNGNIKCTLNGNVRYVPGDGWSVDPNIDGIIISKPGERSIEFKTSGNNIFDASGELTGTPAEIAEDLTAGTFFKPASGGSFSTATVSGNTFEHTQGTIQQWSLSSNATLSITGLNTGEPATGFVEITQGGSGGFSPTLPGVDNDVQIRQAAGDKTFLGYIWDGSEIYWNSDYIVSGSGGSTFTGDIKARRAFGSSLKGQSVVCQMSEITGTHTLVDSEMLEVMVEIPEDTTITNFHFYQVGAGVFTGDNFNGLVLCSIDPSTGSMTEIARSANDANIWKSTATSVPTIALVTPIAVTAGFYAVLLVANWSAVTTSPTIGKGTGTATDAMMGFTMSNSVKLVGWKASVTTITTPLAMSALNGGYSIKPWIGLS